MDARRFAHSSCHRLVCFAGVLLLLAIGGFASRAASAQSYLPAINIGTAALISPSSADSYYGSGSTSSDGLSGLTGTETPTPPEIVNLAAALKNDPDLIYRYVHNNIRNTWTYGLAKGALGAEIDKNGTDFDQAELMVALLRQAGFSTSYIAGTIVLNQTQFSAWTGITNALPACQLLSGGGIPAAINGTGNTACSTFGASTPVSSVQMAHVWIQVTIPGSHAAGCSASDVCAFDPSYKAYTWKTGIPLATAMGFTSGAPLSAATSGMQSGTDPSGAPWVSQLNANSLNSALSGYGSNLASYIQSNSLQGAQMEDITGGGVIAADYSTIRQSALPYADPSPPYQPHVWTPPTDTARYNAIPNQYRSTLASQGFIRQYNSDGTYYDARMFNVTFYADEIYGRRLTVATDFTQSGINHNEANYTHNTITLLLDGNAMANVPAFTAVKAPGTVASATSRGYPAHITLTANHPYSASASGTPTTTGDYMDVTVDKPVVLITPVTVVHAWGEASAALFDKWSGERAADNSLPHQIYGPKCPSGDGGFCPSNYFQPTADFARDKAAADFMAQTARAAHVNADLANEVLQIHHMLGFVYGDAQINVVYADPPTNSKFDYVENDSFDRIDVDTGISMTSRVADSIVRRAAIQSYAATSAAIEGSVSGQVADLPDTSSTVSRFEWGNSPPTDAHQNPRALGPQRFYQFNSTTASAAAGLLTSEGYTSSQCTSQGSIPWTSQPGLGTAYCAQWISSLAGELSSYAQAGFTLVASQEAFLGPGQRGGGIFPTVNSHGVPLGYIYFPSKQRGGAFIATKNDANGDPVEIAHIIIGLNSGATTVVTKGGGGGNVPTQQQNYNPAEAADILKARFVDRSDALGVNLSNGSLAYSSPTTLKIGNGDAPYSLSASLTYQPGPLAPTQFGPAPPTDPQPGWKQNWLNKLSISGSGFEAMGKSDIRAAIGTIVSFYATQDIYKSTQSVQRDTAAPLALAWWAHRLTGNVATVAFGADSKQFVQTFNGQWIHTGPGYASLTQAGSRTPYEYTCPSQSNPPPYPGSRGWDYSGLSFTVAGAHGDTRSFGYWVNNYWINDESQCGLLKGFRLTSWTFPYGMTITPVYTPAPIGVDTLDTLTEVDNSVGRKLTISSTAIGNGLSGSDARTVQIAAPDSNGNIPSMTDPANATTTFTYQLSQAQSATLRPVPFSLLYQVFTADNATQANVKYVYDAQGRVSQAYDAVAIQQGTRGPYSFFIADGTRGERDDPLGQAYRVDYDTYGHPGRFTDELGLITLANFDSRSRPTSYTYPEGDCDVLGYDDRNNVTDYWRVDTASACNTGAGSSHVLHASDSYDPTWDMPQTITDARGNTTTLAYYASGNGASLLHTATRPTIAEGTPVYSFIYDAAGKPLTVTVPFTSSTNITTSNVYDSSENLTSSTLDPGSSPHVNAVTGYSPTAQGDVASITDPRGFVTTSLYDNDRRKTEDDYHNGDASAPLNAATLNVYDLVGRVTDKEAGTAFSGTTVMTWLTTAHTVYSPTSKPLTVTDADNRTTTTSYDNGDRKLTVTDPVSRSTHFVYCAPGDANCAADQVKIELRAWAGANNNCSVSGTLQECYRQVSYFGDGEQKTITDANGNVTNYVYDGFRRLTQSTFPDSSYELLTLDENGNVKARRNRAAESLTYVWNALNWMTSKVSPNPAVTTSLAYKLNGAAASLTDTAGNTMAYGYDTAGRPNSEADTIANLAGTKTASYILDASGNRTQLTWPDGYYVTYGYDNLNRMTTVLDAGGTLATYSYDPLSRRKNLAYGTGASMAYTYTNTPDIWTLAHTFAGGTNNNTYSYGYTNAHQLWTAGVSIAAWQWQPSGTASTSYTPNILNQYASVNGVAYGYDGKGNLTSDGTTTYTFDAENRLLTATKTGLAASYAYDPMGRRTRKSGTGVTQTFFVSNGTDEIAEYNGSGALVTRYVPGPAIDEPVAQVTVAGMHSYFHTDRQGSIVAMSDASANLVEGPYVYDAYGNCFVGSTPCGTSGQPYRFTGRRLDPETQLYYYRARFYSAALGRFLQTDPVGYTADLNLYTYVGNDPSNQSDPTGRKCVSNTKAKTTTCTTPVTGSRIPITVTFPTPTGWPSVINSGSTNYHGYDKTVSAGTGSANKADALRQGIVNKPTPGSDNQPATPQGTSNDATPHTGLIGTLAGDVKSPVISYVRTDENGTTVVVNVTQPGHPLFPGYVIRSVEIANGEAVIHNSGEGTGSAQSWGLASDVLINHVWIQQSQDIINSSH